MYTSVDLHVNLIILLIEAIDTTEEVCGSFDHCSRELQYYIWNLHKCNIIQIHNSVCGTDNILQNIPNIQHEWWKIPQNIGCPA